MKLICAYKKINAQKIAWPKINLISCRMLITPSRSYYTSSKQHVEQAQTYTRTPMNSCKIKKIKIEFAALELRQLLIPLNHLLGLLASYIYLQYIGIHSSRLIYKTLVHTYVLRPACSRIHLIFISKYLQLHTYPHT